MSRVDADIIFRVNALQNFDCLYVAADAAVIWSFLVVRIGYGGVSPPEEDDEDDDDDEDEMLSIRQKTAIDLLCSGQWLTIARDFPINKVR